MRDLQKIAELLIFVFLSFAILWKGGKALDAVWLLAFVAVAVTFLDIFFTPHQQNVHPSPFPWTMALLFLGWTVASFIFSLTRNYGLDEVMMTASLVLLLHFALTRQPDSLGRFQSRLARTIASVALIACGIGVLVYTLQPVSRFVGTFFDYRFTTDYWPNAWAEFLLLAWPMLVWSLWKGMRVRFDLLKALILGFVLACLLLSYSRGGILVFALQIGFLGFITCFTLRQNFPLKRIAMISAIASLAAVLVFAGVNQVRSQTFSVQSIVAKATFSSDEGTSSVSERAQFWRQAVALAKQRPLFGWGPYSFRFVQPHLEESVLATSDHPHNVFLKLAMERGVPAALLFIFLVVYCLMSGGKMENAPAFANASAGKKWKMENDWMLKQLMTVSIVGVLLHNLIDYNLQFVAIALPLWLMLGILVPRSSTVQNRKATYGCGHTFGWLREIFVVLLASVLLVVALREGWYLFASSRARAFEVDGDYPEALHWYEKTDASLFPRDAWLSRAVILMTNADPVGSQSALSRALDLNAEDYRVWKLQGNLSLSLNHFDAARTAFEHGYTFGRYNALGITRVLVELYRRDRATLNARRHEFELLLNEYGLAIEQNTHFIDLSSNVEELQRLCSLLAAIHPSDAKAYSALSERSAKHAAVERARLSARTRGLLW